ncbi:GbsR/MarR family transcriptional regulator [Phytoactinopolyspora mesophila]|nr:helix-turn-helix domain-containing protein [Phytoactinopolyspora mesophila]
MAQDEHSATASRAHRHSQDAQNSGPATAHETDEAWWRVVDRLALVFSDGGLSRMPARVFAFVLVDDDERYTARQLADGLQVSPAAISGALQSLVSVGLLAREREPGSRADVYRVYDGDVWARIMQQREPVTARYESVLREGAAALAPGQGARRLHESAEYMSFMHQTIRQAVMQWHEYRRQLNLDPPAGSRHPS